MKVKQDWKSVGRFIAVSVELFTMISSAFKKFEAGIEAIEWVVGGGKEFMVEKLDEIAREYRRRNPYPAVWRTIWIGTGIKDVEGYREALRQAACGISEWAGHILYGPTFKMSSEEMELELINISTEEMGFKDGATMGGIYARAKELLFGICPDEVGPRLAVELSNQPKGDVIIVVREPIAGSTGRYAHFEIQCDFDGKRHLQGDRGSLDTFYNAGVRWVFVRRE